MCHSLLKNFVWTWGTVYFASTSIFTYYLPYFIFMAVYLFSLKPILALCIILIFLPSLFTHQVQMRNYKKMEDTVVPVRREMDYYEQCIVSRAFFKETRLLGGTAFFKKLYSDALKLFNKEKWAADRRAALLECASLMATVLGYVAVLILLVRALLDQSIGVGIFAAVYASIHTMHSMMNEIVGWRIGNVAKNIGTVHNLIAFLDIPEKEGAGGPVGKQGAAFSGVKASDVSFAYPNATRDSLRRITLAIDHGETVAIVGENGAGKSTLVKVLLGLYAPTDGAMTLDGKNTDSALPSDLFSRVSAVLQDYQKYKLTLRENISISQMNGVDEEKLRTVATRAGVVMDEETFPEGLDTVLSKEFGGTDLSGGQWQRIAIARGLYKDHEMIVLDEPTASIDPVEETRIYKKFADISKGKCAIVVTHRLGAARIADRIVVMDDGEIVQMGTHEQLVADEGKYQQMWRAQAKYYT